MLVFLEWNTLSPLFFRQTVAAHCWPYAVMPLQSLDVVLCSTCSSYAFLFLSKCIVFICYHRCHIFPACSASGQTLRETARERASPLFQFAGGDNCMCGFRHKVQVESPELSLLVLAKNRRRLLFSTPLLTDILL